MNSSSAENIPTREHIGVYGIHLKPDNQVLLILKGRGPYKGMYDLPGGGIKKNETKEEALNREYKEEIGTGILSYKFLYEDVVTFPYMSPSEGKVTFRHKGYFYIVSLPSDVKIKMSPDGFDSMGAMYVNISDIIEDKVIVAPIARKAILCAISVYITKP
ncbi:MAG: NUDIX domain-containing protein [Candidatus Paceibacterota bacterium]